MTTTHQIVNHLLARIPNAKWHNTGGGCMAVQVFTAWGEVLVTWDGDTFNRSDLADEGRRPVGQSGLGVGLIHSSTGQTLAESYGRDDNDTYVAVSCMGSGGWTGCLNAVVEIVHQITNAGAVDALDLAAALNKLPD